MPPTFTDTFPFVLYPRHAAPVPMIGNAPEHMGADHVTGLLVVSPLLLVGTLCLIVYRKQLTQPGLSLCTALYLATGLNLTFITSCRFAAARYAFEIYGPLLLCSIWGVWIWLNQIKRPLIKLLAKSIIFMAMFLSITAGVLGTFNGYYNKRIDPAAAYTQFINLFQAP